jgi:hypothetical protein
MRNPETGAMAIAYIGFSWAALFFGPFPALFRGAVSLFVIYLAAWVATGGLFGWVLAFCFNGWHRRYLDERGFHPIGVALPVSAASSPSRAQDDEPELPSWARDLASYRFPEPAPVRDIRPAMAGPKPFGKRVAR